QKSDPHEYQRSENTFNKTDRAKRDSFIAPRENDVLVTVNLKSEQLPNKEEFPLKLEENGSWQDVLGGNPSKVGNILCWISQLPKPSKNDCNYRHGQDDKRVH